MGRTPAIDVRVDKLHPTIQAVARKESIRPETRTQGLQLQLGLDALTAMKGEIARPETPLPPPAPRLKHKEMALTKKLIGYQEADN